MAAGLVLVASGVWAHGNVELDEDPCVRRMGTELVHFSVYEPGVDEKAQYCAEVPEATDAVVVVDLVGSALRSQPVSLRVYDLGADDDLPLAQTVPEPHPHGVIEAEVRFPEPGRYAVAVAVEGDETRTAALGLYVDVINWPRVISQLVYWSVMLGLAVFLGARVVRFVRRLWRRATADDVLL